MNSSIDPITNSITPRIARFFNILPGESVAMGAVLALFLFLLYFSGRFILDAGHESSAGDLRLTIIHILLTAYSVFAFAYFLETAKTTTQKLQQVIQPTVEWQAEVDRIGGHHGWFMIIWAGVVIAIYVYATEVTTVGSEPWDWGQTNYDTRWMRILGPIFSICTGVLNYVIVMESLRLGRLSDCIGEVDLFDLRPYQPLVRLGLTNALLVLGLASVLLLFLMEPGFAVVIGQLALMFAVLAWAGLMLPLRGFRKKINEAKERELDWCRHAMQTCRTRLKEGDSNGLSMAEIGVYKKQIESVRNWPFDNPTLIRFALYLLIPLVSMFGGAIVERGLELFVF